MPRPAAVSIFAVLAIGLATSSAHAQTSRACPHAESDRDKIELTLKSVATCGMAYDLMNACRSNTSGDVALAEIVIERCEGSFVAGLSPVAKRNYDAERQACARRYPRSGGTMNVSFSATCLAGVAAQYARATARSSRGK